jgi:hypothetical protein
MIRSVHQRRTDAIRRVTLAVDRFFAARTPEAKARAVFWADAWATSAGVAPSRARKIAQ